MSGPFGSQQWMYASGGFYPYELDHSLKFEDGDSGYLSRTPTSAGNRKTFTWSGWVKRANVSTYGILFSAGNTNDLWNSTSVFHIGFVANTNQISVYNNGTYLRTTNARLRDASSWYHLVVAVDTTNATAGDRVKVYINGEEQSSFATSNNPSLNLDTLANATHLHVIGGQPTNVTNSYIDAYLTEVNFIDGTALDASSFGEFKEGIWIPKDPTGLTYGTNGFRLPFTETTTANGFNTVTYSGNNSVQSIEGVGFQPDFVWLKRRDATGSHALHDSVRGAGNRLISDTTAAESSGSNFTSFDTDGFSLNSSGGNYNASSATYVAWCWDAGTGSAASNTDGSITSSVKANQDYGFSIASYTGTGANATVGHGLGVAPDMIIIKSRTTASDWGVYHSANTAAPETDYLELNLANATADSNQLWNDTAPTSSVFTIGTANMINKLSDNFVAYCFADVTGHQKIGSYTGNGSSTGPTVTTGFAPAFLLIKNASTGSTNWIIKDNTRIPSATQESALEANTSTAEQSSLSTVDFLSNGFQIKNTGSYTNTSGDTYIYLAIADTRDAAFWTDASGNGNDWTPNALQHSDVMPDTPTDGFSVMNPLYGDGGTTWKEGNLELSTANKGNNTSTFFMESGKWYWEAMGEGYVGAVCAFDKGQYNDSISVSGSDSIGYYTNGNVYWGTGSDGTPATYTSSDIIGVALNMDDGQISFYKNNTLQVTLNFSSTISRLATEGCYACYNNGSTSTTKVVNFNFGQDSSFNAKEIAQGNADENGKGDFYYAPPSGYLALCNANLPDPAIDPNKGENPEDYFNTVTYTGTGSAISITGVGFQPDWVWIKDRSTNYAHQLTDSVRGATKTLFSNLTNVENTDAQKLTSFDTDGFSYGTNVGGNTSSNSYVAWNWLAGGTGVSNTDGTITSTVSANTEAGFSIATGTYTGGITSQTFGHGLGVTPDMIIVKDRTVTSGWGVWHQAYGSYSGNTQILLLSGTNSLLASGNYFGTINSSVASVSAGLVLNNSDFVAYCFHNVEGYSEFGSYAGNGSADGPFVYTGFRPAFVMVKRTDAADDWHLYDATRDTFNPEVRMLAANLSDAENTYSTARMDFLSNGIKMKANASTFNASSGTYIYMAFAKQPFKYSNAR